MEQMRLTGEISKKLIPKEEKFDFETKPRSRHSNFINDRNTIDFILTTFTEVFIFKYNDLDITFYTSDIEIKQKVKRYMKKNFNINLVINEFEMVKDMNKRIISMFPFYGED